jgi:hypothetical protein
MLIDSLLMYGEKAISGPSPGFRASGPRNWVGGQADYRIPLRRICSTSTMMRLSQALCQAIFARLAGDSRSGESMETLSPRLDVRARQKFRELESDE